MVVEDVVVHGFAESGAGSAAQRAAEESTDDGASGTTDRHAEWARHYTDSDTDFSAC